MQKVRVLIFGHVQGIGFRYWVKRKYKKLGIEGEVWNNEDGTVGAELEGNKGQIETMMKYFNEGPPLARVNKVDILD